LASVSVDDVRDVINVSSAEVPDVKVLKMIKRAEVTLELEIDREIEYDRLFSTNFRRVFLCLVFSWFRSIY